jgi:hypothetical protein
MRRQNKRTKASKESTSPCESCGIAVTISSGDTSNTWRRCKGCRHTYPGQVVAKMLARTGIDADPADVAVLRALRTLGWKANANDATSEPLAPAGTRQAIARTVSGRTTATLQGRAPLGVGSREPWAHVKARELRRAIANARAEIEAEREPVECETGLPCAGCGVRRAVGWFDYGRSTGGGVQLVLCGDCSRCWERCGESFHEGRWETRLCADALGVRPVMGLGDRYSFRAFHDVLNADPGGYEQRFGYVDAETLAAARRNYWGRHPNEAPADFRARQKRAAILRARIAAQKPPPLPPPLVVPGRESSEVSR